MRYPRGIHGYLKGVQCHGGPLGFPWGSHEIPMGQHGISMVDPLLVTLYTHGRPISTRMDSPWEVWGSLMDRPWVAHGLHGPPHDQ